MIVNKKNSCKIVSILISLNFFIILCCNHILLAKPEKGTITSERTIQFSYSALVKNIPNDSEKLEIWIPIPKSDTYQTISELKITCDSPHTLLSDPEYNNSILSIKKIDGIPDNLSVSIDFLVKRKGYNVLSNLNKTNETVYQDSLKRYLLSNNLVPTGGIIAAKALKLIDNNMSDIEKSRTIYDHVVTTMDYDKSGKGWGVGDAIYACNVRKGNCTDFHSLFIGMNRACGIPSRFIIGFPIPESKTEGEIKGYHCWAEFYIKGLGWLPVDASEAHKHQEKSDMLFGGLDANRVQFSIGRDIHLKNDSNTEPLNYFIYPYVQCNDKAHTDVERRIWFKELTQ